MLITIRIIILGYLWFTASILTFAYTYSQRADLCLLRELLYQLKYHTFSTIWFCFILIPLSISMRVCPSRPFIARLCFFACAFLPSSSAFYLTGPRFLLVSQCSFWMQTIRRETVCLNYWASNRCFLNSGKAVSTKGLH